jgi:hypothetical protein
MKARFDWAPRGLAVCCVLACALATTSAALAQEAPAAAAAEEDEEEEEGFEETKPSSDSAKEDSGKDEDAEPAAAAETTAAAPAAPAVSEDDLERQRVVAAVGLELVPSSGYPEPYVRGIAGGSLRSLFHGLQWPQLPYIAGGPKTRLGFSGGGWVDTSYRSLEAGLAESTENDKVDWRQQSRFVLRATPTFSLESGWFVQGQAELVANSDVPSANQLVDTDDLWIRAGKWDVFDVHVGRFQGWEIYHLGMGLDLNTFERQGADSENSRPPGVYGVTYFWDRPQGAGNVAVHLFPTDFARIELLGRFGPLGGGLNVVSVRPVGIVDFGFVKFKVGAEYGKQRPAQRGEVCDAAGTCKDKFPQRRTERGVGASLQFVLAPYAEFGFNFATALTDERSSLDVPDLGKTTDTTSYGGFLNVSVSGPFTFGDPGDLVIGGGLHNTELNNELVNPTTGKNNYYTHSQLFAAVQYTLWKRLAIKLVYAHATGGFHPLQDTMPIEYENTATSYRLRFAYDF